MLILLLLKLVAFPTHVGMNRFSRLTRYKGLSVPHTRGDEPIQKMEERDEHKRSPHTWG